MAERGVRGGGEFDASSSKGYISNGLVTRRFQQERLATIDLSRLRTASL